VFPVRTMTRASSTLVRAAQGAKPRMRYSLLRKLGRPFEKELRALHGVVEDWLCFDIAANHGQSIEAIRMMCPLLEVVAFEPQPTLNDGSPWFEEDTTGVGELEVPKVRPDDIAVERRVA
jgi:hypothetical protein